MRIRVLGIALGACCFLSVRVAARELSVGDPAPPLQVSRWIKGAKVERFERGKVYLLDFWATWCGPCIESFPRLTRLQKKYADKGVTDIGVSIWEEDQAAVEPFVKARSDAMGYSVALDDVPADAVEKGERGRSDGKVATAWMRAAGKNLIPTVFIVGRDGKIAWIFGDSSDDLPSTDRVGDDHAGWLVTSGSSNPTTSCGTASVTLQSPSRTAPGRPAMIMSGAHHRIANQLDEMRC
jgi:thiol-disulfide isomerase/thioredoxin